MNLTRAKICNFDIYYSHACDYVVIHAIVLFMISANTANTGISYRCTLIQVLCLHAFFFLCITYWIWFLGSKPRYKLNVRYLPWLRICTLPSNTQWWTTKKIFSIQNRYLGALVFSCTSFLRFFKTLSPLLMLYINVFRAVCLTI